MGTCLQARIQVPVRSSSFIPIAHRRDFTPACFLRAVSHLRTGRVLSSMSHVRGLLMRTRGLSAFLLKSKVHRIMVANNVEEPTVTPESPNYHNRRYK